MIKTLFDALNSQKEEYSWLQIGGGTRVTAIQVANELEELEVVLHMFESTMKQSTTTAD